MRPTLQDMASILNLSKSTVSRALAGDPRVAEATRNRVAALAERIGYRPNPIAQALLPAGLILSALRCRVLLGRFLIRST